MTEDGQLRLPIVQLAWLNNMRSEFPSFSHMTCIRKTQYKHNLTEKVYEAYIPRMTTTITEKVYKVYIRVVKKTGPFMIYFLKN